MSSAPGLPKNPAPPPRPRRLGLRHILVPAVALAVAGLVVFALSRLDLHAIGHDLLTASPAE